MFDFTTPKIVKLPRIHDPRGNLTVAQGGVEVPFDIKRAYWIYDVRPVKSAAAIPIMPCRNCL